MVLSSRMKLLWLPALALLFSSSCSRDSSSVVEDWMDAGWRVEERFGEPGPVESYSQLQSEKAQAVKASWVVNGEWKTKLYQQRSKLFLVLRFKKADGDVFAVVMSKRK